MDYAAVKMHLQQNQYTWLVTGTAGFIGSNLLETLLFLKQKVIGLDNFSTGFKENLHDVRHTVGELLWSNFSFIHGDIRSLEDCQLACQGVDYVLHQAAIGSVPKSIHEPLSFHQSNIDGFFNMLIAARDKKVKKIIFASSSSVYGNHPELPKIEENIGEALSPYALTKYVNELYAAIFARVYQLDYIGLRYFNVFGKRQNPNGAYAAVIPKWIQAMLNDEIIYINGDGKTSRDFCYIDNVVQANILAALSKNAQSSNRIYNVACHQSTTLLEVFEMIQKLLKNHQKIYHKVPIYLDERLGDIKHSFAAIEAIEQYLNYQSLVTIDKGMASLIDWTCKQQIKRISSKDRIQI